MHFPLIFISKHIKINNNDTNVPENIMTALCDDLNTPKAIATVFDLAKMINKSSSTHDVSEGLILFRDRFF